MSLSTRVSPKYAGLTISAPKSPERPNSTPESGSPSSMGFQDLAKPAAGKKILLKVNINCFTELKLVPDFGRKPEPISMADGTVGTLEYYKDPNSKTDDSYLAKISSARGLVSLMHEVDDKTETFKPKWLASQQPPRSFEITDFVDPDPDTNISISRFTMTDVSSPLIEVKA